MAEDKVAGAQVAGAPLPEQTKDVPPMLSGKGEGITVSIHNPLTVDFRVQYARSVVQTAAETENEKFAREKAGLAMGKDMGQSQAHAVQYLVLKAGDTMNLPGDIAQLAARQLTTYIIQQKNKGKALAPISDPVARHEVEKEIIVSISDNMEFFNQATPEEKTEKQLNELNTGVIKDAEEPNKVPDPAPGQGTSF